MLLVTSSAYQHFLLQTEAGAEFYCILFVRVRASKNCTITNLLRHAESLISYNNMHMNLKAFFIIRLIFDDILKQTFNKYLISDRKN